MHVDITINDIHIPLPHIPLPHHFLMYGESEDSTTNLSQGSHNCYALMACCTQSTNKAIVLHSAPIDVQMLILVYQFIYLFIHVNFSQHFDPILSF